MCKLASSVCYLAGPIDFSDDLGVSFRKKLILTAKHKGLGIKFLDPTDKLEGLQADVGDEQSIINDYRKKRSWNKLSALMKKIVRVDLRQIDLADFVIVFIDTQIHMCGSYHELVEADRQKKPVLTIIKQGKENCPSWLFGTIDHNLMFSSIEECVEYLYKVDQELITLDDRWVLFREQLASI